MKLTKLMALPALLVVTALSGCIEIDPGLVDAGPGGPTGPQKKPLNAASLNNGDTVTVNVTKDASGRGGLLQLCLRNQATWDKRFSVNGGGWVTAKRNSIRCTQVPAAQGQRVNFSRHTISGWIDSGGKTYDMTDRGGSRIELVWLQ
ncbi:hypothetical protein FHY55_03295 [Oceanicola sp. D3]|uniref:hypothetical protein n=1 Tax=Oceanicola sp. D3 TaxID=2587163 RepID=UPI001121D629|nr:hypothetical protein [Oceanicola sp. D3]QDC08326.1 hypothetical protein FHY55_03295 [Oceanicola sp. D3]